MIRSKRALARNGGHPVKRKHAIHRIGRLVALLLSLALMVACALPAVVCADSPAENPAKIVRVGWYEPPFYITDQFGRMSGYAYE